MPRYGESSSNKFILSAASLFRTKEAPEVRPGAYKMSNNRDSSVSPPPTKRRRRETRVLAPTLPLRPVEHLQKDEFRIFTWNVNGIQPFLQPAITSFFAKAVKRQARTASPGSATLSKPNDHSLRGCLKRWKWPQVVCLQEVKIASSDESTQEQVRKAVRSASHSEDHHYRAFLSLPSDKMNAKGWGGKLYGVCTLVREDVFQEFGGGDEKVVVEPVEWEREGRVLLLKLPKSKLLIVNVYAVNGTANPYRDASGQVTGTRHDYKRKFHTLLQTLVHEYQVLGWSAVVAGDLNIARDFKDGFPGIRLAPAHVENRRDFDEKFMQSSFQGGLEMIDSFRDIHGSERKYTYRSPHLEWGASADRVDLILCSKDLKKQLRALKDADILDEISERATSDHLPSFVTLHMSALAARL